MASDAPDLLSLIGELEGLRADLLRAEAEQAEAIAAVHPRHRRSARNLVHYVALRQRDVRDLQTRLALLGLSSLGRLEAHALATIDRVLASLEMMVGRPHVPVDAPVEIGEGRDILRANAAAVLGPAPGDRSTRIMVTMPSEAADDPDLVREMVSAGMDVARVNCAHDGAEDWVRMVSHLRKASADTGRAVRVAMDLAGPKLRTGPLEPGPRVIRVAPVREATGMVIAPGTVWLTAIEAGPPGVTSITVRDGGWVERRRPGDVIEVVDTRGARRKLPVSEVHDGGCLVEVFETTYFGAGLPLEVRPPASSDTTAIGELPHLEQALVLRPGDEVVLTRDLSPAPVPPRGTSDPARIGCTLPHAFESVLPGERVLFDDGKLGGEVVEVGGDEILVRVVDGRPGGTKLRAEKGINLPDTDLRLPALTDDDLRNLDVVVAHADIVDVSFVRHPSDVALLHQELRARGGEALGIVLKIETVSGFRQLPELILTALQAERVGVMIARGDLAVEAGYERLAEVQEEILWLCEAAHVPVIWATQVLDTLARTGRPSRPEVSDAAMAQRAECVMLNKGPYIVQAIETLAGILVRMTGHQAKKSAVLRPLQAWER